MRAAPCAAGAAAARRLRAPLCLQIAAALLHPRGVNMLYIYIYVHIIYYLYNFSGQPAAPERNARSFPFISGTHEMATRFLAGARRGWGTASALGEAGARRCPRSPGGQPAPPCPPPPARPTPGRGVPRPPRTQEAALTYLAEGKGQVAKTYQQNASPGPHLGLVHFRHGGKATLMERSCRPAPAAQEFSTIPQGKGSGVARGSSASRVGRGWWWFNYGAAAVCMFPSLRERGCSPFCRSRSLLLALRTRPAGTSAYLLRSDQSETQGVDPERSRNAHHLSGAAAPLAAGGAGSRLPPPPRPLAPRRDSGISVFAGCSPTPLCSPSTLCPFLKKGEKKNLYWYGSNCFSR